MSNSASRSKLISTSIRIHDIVGDAKWQGLLGEQKDAESLKSALLKAYEGDTGLLEAFVEEDRVILQWMPESLNREAEAYHQAAVEFAKRKLMDKARSNWEKAIDLNPEDADYRYKLALILYEKRQFADAVIHLERAVTLCPIHFKAHLLLGMNWMKLRKFDKAEKHLVESRRLNPGNMLVHLNLGAVYSVQRQYNEAIAAFEQCIELNPQETRAFLGMARVYTVLSDTTNANRFFRRVIELAPGSKMAEYAMRAIQVEAPAFDEPASLTFRQSGMASENREDQFAQGMGLFIAGQYGRAADEYKAFLQTHPNDDYAWYLLGETLIRGGKTEEAADCFKRAIRINSKRGLYFKSLGIALHHLGRSNEVVQVLKKAMELGKRDSLTFTLHGANLLRERKVDDGINHLQMALKKNPNNALALYQLALALVQQNEPQRAQMLVDQILSFEYDLPIKAQAEKLGQTLSAA